ncbi:MAG: 30S ribosomal protein S17 [Nitrospira sp.]|nr:30S ribosomal protein S17 [Nitrospira sp.]MBH0184154.1 30S ribosomal protein S17 [Nitrospira sp.]MBH0187579.1 30S ribosomal protein S17 [Nitrospira sp.]
MSEGVKKHHRFGSVVSNKMQKTVVVAVSRSVIHPVYRKVLKRVTRLKAHDENGLCKVGDRVKIIQTRPLSKDKNWRVVQIMEKGQAEK